MSSSPASQLGPLYIVQNGQSAYNNGLTDQNGNRFPSSTVSPTFSPLIDPNGLIDRDIQAFTQGANNPNYPNISPSQLALYNPPSSVTSGTRFDDTGAQTVTFGYGTNVQATNIIPQDAVFQKTYSYKDESGATQQYTLHYKYYDIATSFGCSGIQDSNNGPSNLAIASQVSAPATGQSAYIIANQVKYFLADYLELPDGGQYTFTYESTPGLSGYVTGRLASVTLPSGGSISYSYGAINCTDGSTLALTRTISDANGHISTWTYNRSQSGFMWNTSIYDPENNESVYQFTTGVPAQTAYGPLSQVINGVSFSATAYQVAILQAAMPLPATSFYPVVHREYEGSNKLLRETDTCYNNDCPSSSTISYPILARKVTTLLPGSNGASVSSSVSETYTTVGSVETSTSTDFSGNVIREVDNSYEWRGPVETHITTLQSDDNGSEIITINYYDEPGSIIATSNIPNHVNGFNYGNLTSIYSSTGTLEDLGSGGYAIIPMKRCKYYDTGKVQSCTDADANNGAGGSSTTYVYDQPTGGTLISSSTTNANGSLINGLAHLTQYFHDTNIGNLISTIDENNQQTIYKHDLFKRPTLISYPDGGTTSYCYVDMLPSGSPVTSPAGCNGSIPNSVTITKRQSSTTSVSTMALMDGLSRTIQTQLLTDPLGTVYQDTSYDLLGNVHTSSNPYRSTSDPTYGITVTHHDALGRVWRQELPGGSSLSTNYSANVVTSTDEAGNTTTRTFDAIGRLAQVIEPNQATTQYSYDFMNNLLSVIQQGNSSNGDQARIRGFSYDGLSRLVTSTNPETGKICYGTFVNGVCIGGYDPNGNLLNKTDANNITTSYAYDALNRLTSQISSDGSISNQFYYDSSLNLWGTPHPCTNGIGRLCLADHGGVGGTAFDYDAMGRVSDTKYAVITAQPTYVPGLAAVYDLAGNMTQLSYPDGLQVTQAFDGAGRLATVASGGTTYIGGVNGSGSIAYTPSGAVQGFAFGNGVSQTNLYNNRLQPCHTMVSSPLLGSNPTGGNLLDRASYYSPLGGSPTNCGNEAGNNGNMYVVVDNLNTGWSQGFTYDSLNRLTSAGRSDGGYNHTYNYDSFGNLIVQDNLHTNLQYAIDPSTNELLMNPLAPGLLDQYGHQMNAFQYDYAGNMVSSGINNIGGHQYTYNALSQIMTVDGGSTASYAYNGSDQRELKTTPSGWTEYVYFNGQPLSEQNSNGTWSDYIYANGQKIAKVDSQKAVFHVQGYRDGSDTSCGVEGPLVGASPSVIGLTIQQGDQLVFDYQQNLPMYGGLALLFTDGVGSGDLVDTNGTGQPLWEDGETDGQWHHMVGSLTTHVGETVGYVYVGTHDWAPLGNFSVSLANAAVVHANGSTTPIFTGQQASVYAFTGNTCGGQAMTNGTVMMPISDPTMNTTYFLDDHLGTAQMQLSGGGWPIWQGQFTPFGAELPDGSTDMHYKFTGKERDAESGLDYFGARYYASNMGRFMSPDWAGKPEAVPYSHLDNPQSLNLYSYVYNNPLSKADPDGHEVPGPYRPELNFDQVRPPPIGPRESQFNSIILESSAAFFSGGAVPELAAAGMEFKAGISALSATGFGVSAISRTIGLATGAPGAAMNEAASAVQTVTSPVGLPVAVATRNLETGSKASDAVSAVKLGANPREALHNPADAALTVKGAVRLVKDVVGKAASAYSALTSGPPTPKPPPGPSCSIAGACK